MCSGVCSCVCSSRSVFSRVSDLYNDKKAVSVLHTSVLSGTRGRKTVGSLQRQHFHIETTQVS